MLRDTTLCSAEMIWVAMITGSMPLSGRAPCAPLPVMWMSNRPPPAICGPERMANLPTSSFGPVVHAEDLLAGELLEQPVLDHRLGAAAAFLGRLEDEVHGAVEVARRRRGTWRRPAAWWCGRHGRRHACGPCAGCDGRRCCARPSAARPCRRAGRSPRGLLPTRMVPTTPVLPMPVVTSQPHSLSFSRHDAAGALLLEAELGMGVDVAADGGQLGRRGGDLGLDVHDVQDSSRKDVITRRNSPPCTFG